MNFPRNEPTKGFESNDVLRGVANEKETRDEVPQPCRRETGANSARETPGKKSPESLARQKQLLLDTVIFTAVAQQKFPRLVGDDVEV